MNSYVSIRPWWALSVAIFSIIFGVLSIFPGGRAPFFITAAQTSADDHTTFFLLFNFIACFLYVIAGMCLYHWQHWAAPLALSVAVVVGVVLAVFAFYIVMSNAFEMRTIGAMLLRGVAWIAIAIAANRAFGSRFQNTAN